MKTNENRSVLYICVKTAKIVLCISLLFSIFVLIYYGMINRANVMEDDACQFISDLKVNESNENTLSVVANIPSGISDNEYLFFLTRKDTDVYINNELRKDFIEKRDVNIPGGSIKLFFMVVPLNNTDSGAEVKIVMHSVLHDDPVLDKIFVSTRFGMLKYLLNNEGLSFYLTAIILIFSFVVFIVSVILRFVYKLKINMVYGALGIFVLAAYNITDSYICSIVLGVNHVIGLLNFMFCLTIPLAPAVYLNAVQLGRHKKSMSCILIISSLNTIVWPLLHFTGVVPFYNVITIGNAIFAVLAIYGIGLLIYDAVKGNIKRYIYTFIGFLGFLIFCIIQLVLLLLNISNTSLPMIVGLGFLLTFVVIQQIDDLRKINLERQYAIDISEAKTKFLASMSHEIRTPINAILGMNEMILRENNDKVIDEYSRSIKTSGKMLLMLVNDVLDFSKIEAGKLEINESRFRMSEMLRDVISLVKERADEKSLELKTEIIGKVPDQVISDEFRIRQILVNLINNAIKYTDKGTVTLGLSGNNISDDEFKLVFDVKDTGKGIHKEDQSTLFDAFSRADVKTNVNIEGTGLGLAIVKSILDSMKGSIEVDSEYGVGSEFKVTLPVKFVSSDLLRSDFAETKAEDSKVSENQGFTAPEARILTVDDNQSNLTIVKLFLKKTGIKLDLCNSGNRAIELCRENKYDLILLDHMMPQPDGIETLHIIRKDEASLNKDTKAICLTANALAGSRQMYIDEGFEEYLTKPLDSSILEQTVKNMLPKDKVIEVTDESEIMEFPAEYKQDIKSKLNAIEGLDYNTAIGYCGGEESLLEEITVEIASECNKRCDRMKKSLESKDIKSYAIDAHSIKSSMATIGLTSFSERAKKHEFAAKEDNTDFIYSDFDDFINEYISICEKLK